MKFWWNFWIMFQARHQRNLHKSKCCCSFCAIKAEKKWQISSTPVSLSRKCVFCQSDRDARVSKLSEDFNKWKTVFTLLDGSRLSGFYKLRSSILVMPIKVFPLLYRWEFAFNLEPQADLHHCCSWRISISCRTMSTDSSKNNTNNCQKF